MRLTITDKTIDDYLAWCKIVLSINSAAIAALLFNTSDEVGASYMIKAAAASFIVSLFFLVFFYAGLIEHRNTTSNNTGEITSLLAIIGLFSFVFGFALLALEVIF